MEDFSRELRVLKDYTDKVVAKKFGMHLVAPKRCGGLDYINGKPMYAHEIRRIKHELQNGK